MSDDTTTVPAALASLREWATSDTVLVRIEMAIMAAKLYTDDPYPIARAIVAELLSADGRCSVCHGNAGHVTECPRCWARNAAP